MKKAILINANTNNDNYNNDNNNNLGIASKKMTLTNYMCQEKKEKDLPALKRA